MKGLVLPIYSFFGEQQRKVLLTMLNNKLKANTFCPLSLADFMARNRHSRVYWKRFEK